MRLTLLLSIALVACSSSGEVAQPSVSQSNTTEPTEPPTDGDPAPSDPQDPAPSDPQDPDPVEPKDPVKDAGPTGPAAYTKAELQAIVDDRCSPCHTDLASGGMSLANDFTTNTVDVASTEVPSMKRIAKGDHSKSYLWHKVNGTHTTVGGSGARMPKNGAPFTATEIERLAKYIDAL